MITLRMSHSIDHEVMFLKEVVDLILVVEIIFYPKRKIDFEFSRDGTEGSMWCNANFYT